MNTQEVISLALELEKRDNGSLANELISTFVEVDAVPENSGDIDTESDEKKFSVVYDDYTVEFDAKDGKPVAILTKDGEEEDREVGHEEVFEFMGDYVHPSDRTSVWRLLDERLGVKEKDLDKYEDED